MTLLACHIARIRVIFTASSKADDIVRLTRITAETYKQKFYCRRQSGMNFGYVTENGVNSNKKFIYEIEDIYRFFL